MSRVRNGVKASTGLALLLIGLGVSLATTGVLLGALIGPGQRTLPLDTNFTLTLTGRGDVLDPDSLTPPQGNQTGGEGPSVPRPQTDRDVPIRYQVAVRAEEPSDTRRLTVENGSTLLRTDRPEAEGLLRALVYRVTLDRSTALPVGEGINGGIATVPDMPSAPVHIDGLDAYFPPDTQPVGYPRYDPVSRSSQPLDFLAETEVEGLKAYSFRLLSSPVDLTEVDPSTGVTLPAASIGEEGEESVALRRYRSTEEILTVEPRTGTVLAVEQKVSEYLGRRPGDEVVTALKFTARTEADSQAARVASAQERLSAERSESIVWPSALGGGGGLLILAGLVVFWGRKRQEKSAPQVSKQVPKDEVDNT